MQKIDSPTKGAGDHLFFVLKVEHSSSVLDIHPLKLNNKQIITIYHRWKKILATHPSQDFHTKGKNTRKVLGKLINKFVISNL